MHNDQSRNSRWEWIVPLILALILLWMLLTGNGPTSACCTQTTSEPVATTDAGVVIEAFQFSASANAFTSSGDSTNVAWLAQSDKLKALLNSDMKAEGDDKHVVLTGTVDSESIKQQKGSDTQSFFGAEVTIDNQLVVKIADSVTTTPPPAVKLYFESGKTNLSADASSNLAPIIDWLNSHSDAKAVLSGFHDSTGDLAYNLELAKNRAKMVAGALKVAGIDETRIEMRKPESVDGGSDLTEARRVEVSVE